MREATASRPRKKKPPIHENKNEPSRHAVSASSRGRGGDISDSSRFSQPNESMAISSHPDTHEDLTERPMCRAHAPPASIRNPSRRPAASREAAEAEGEGKCVLSVSRPNTPSPIGWRGAIKTQWTWDTLPPRVRSMGRGGRRWDAAAYLSLSFASTLSSPMNITIKWVGV